MSTMRLRYVVTVPVTKPHECSMTPPCGRLEDVERTYALADGTPVETLQPGDVFFVPWDESGDKCWARWSNCDANHLNVILPNGHHWDIDSRASNCTMKDDRVHRCWVRHGDPTKPETLHVDKRGFTCAAGAGSIAVPGYHGFLHNGELRST